MLRKPQLTATLPDHVLAEIEKNARALKITKSEYLSLIARDWFARDCPPVSNEEGKLKRMASR